jgi:hypothetical protein
MPNTATLTSRWGDVYDIEDIASPYFEGSQFKMWVKNNRPYTVTTNTTAAWSNWIVRDGDEYTTDTYAVTSSTSKAWYTWSGRSYYDVSTTDYAKQYDEHVVAFDKQVRYRPQDNLHCDAWRTELVKRKQAEELRVRAKARKQSLRLLYEFLSKDQWHQLKNYGFFDVRGGASGDVYRIHWLHGDSMVANVEVFKDTAIYAANDNWKRIPWSVGNLKHRLCAHPEWRFTIGDQLLTQKLLIEYEETRFLKIANKHSINTRRPEPRRLVQQSFMREKLGIAA